MFDLFIRLHLLVSLLVTFHNKPANPLICAMLCLSVTTYIYIFVAKGPKCTCWILLLQESEFQYYANRDLIIGLKHNAYHLHVVLCNSTGKASTPPVGLGARVPVAHVENK